MSCKTHLILTAWHRFSHWIHRLNSALTIFSRLHFFHQAFCNVTIKQLAISWLFNEGFGFDVIFLFPWSNKPATSMTTEQFRQLYVGVGIRFSQFTVWQVSGLPLCSAVKEKHLCKPISGYTWRGNNMPQRCQSLFSDYPEIPDR